MMVSLKKHEKIHPAWTSDLDKAMGLWYDKDVLKEKREENL
jgi:hypothetical protein